MEVQTGKIISAQKAPTHFMLAAKIVILVATVVLYVMQMLIAVPLFGAFVLEENWGELDNTRLSAVGILLAVALVLDLVSFVLAIIGSAKQEEPKTKMTVIIKALFIPFFLIHHQGTLYSVLSDQHHALCTIVFGNAQSVPYVGDPACYGNRCMPYICLYVHVELAGYHLHDHLHDQE